MERKSGEVEDPSGNKIAGASVYVLNESNALATIYADNGTTPLANPIVTGLDGEYGFYAANGRYSLNISAPGYPSETVPGLVFDDPADGAVIVTAASAGLTGSGDETAKLNAAFAAAVGKTLVLEAGKTYRYNPATGLTIPAGVSIVSNGAKFRETQAANVYGVTINGDFRADKLTFEFVGGASSRGIYMPGSNVEIGTLELLADTVATGSSGGTYNALKLGPDATPAATGVRIGRIRAANWDRPIVLQNLDDFDIGRIDVDTFRRGTYIKDCRRGDIRGGRARGMSPNNSGRAGENAILIESVRENYATEEIRISNYAAIETGEHGFRLGGGKIIRNVWHVNCSSFKPGSGSGLLFEPDDHGGCGFKVLGPTVQPGARHQGIHYIGCIVEQALLDRPVFRWNHAGFQFGKVYGGSVIGCEVRPTIQEASYDAPALPSCENGLEIIGCESITVTDLKVSYPRNSGIYLYDYLQSGYDWGENKDIKITGGLVVSPGVACLEVVANYTTTSRVRVTGLQCSGGQYAMKVTDGAGSMVDCSAQLLTSGQTVATLLGANAWQIDGAGTMVGGLTANDCRNGSTFTDTTTNARLTHETPGWVAAQSEQITLADDAAITITPKRANGFVMISCPGSAYYGMAWARTTSSSVVVKVAGGSSFAVLNAALAGTTGTDGNVTFGAQLGALYLENRSGSSQVFTVTQI